MVLFGAVQHHRARCVPADQRHTEPVSPFGGMPVESPAEPRESAALNAPAEPDPAGVGPGGGTPYTVYFPGQDGYRAADLAHAAPLPHAGDLVDYLDERGVTHRFRVREVVHTLQVAPEFRSAPRSEAPGAPAEEGAREEAAGFAPDIPEATKLRGGLPEVILEEIS
jgi:hypothetical protein